VPRLAPQVENALFRIAQEALTNVVKHAEANVVRVTLETDRDTVRLIIADDGLGFDASRQNHGARPNRWGVITMAERAEAVGGHCRITSSPDQGTQVTVEVPR
jgi:two-component system sensor histidine kinase UhpB